VSRELSAASADALAVAARELMTRLDAEIGPEGDRWALAAEVDRLLGSGWPSFRVARALLAAGAVRGTGTLDDVRRALAWMRQERRRYRRATGVERNARLMRRTTVVQSEQFA
jgi:hypothetical protein